MVKAPEIIAYLESHGIAIGGVLVPPPSLHPDLLVPICNEFLNGTLLAPDLEKIGKLLLERPEHYYQNKDYSGQSEYPDAVELILLEWAIPTLGQTPPGISANFWRRQPGLKSREQMNWTAGGRWRLPFAA